MKHKILAVAMTVLFAAGCLIGYRCYSYDENEDVISLENVEAVASCEVSNSAGQVIMLCEDANQRCPGTATVIDGVLYYCMGYRVL